MVLVVKPGCNAVEVLLEWMAVAVHRKWTWLGARMRCTSIRLWCMRWRLCMALQRGQLNMQAACMGWEESMVDESGDRCRAC